MIGHAQFRLKDWPGAKVTWTAVREYDDMDVEANTILGTIFQRLGDLVSSDQGVERALENKEISATATGRDSCLNGTKCEKSDGSRAGPISNDVAAAQKVALTSGYLEKSFELYRAGFIEDRNHFYSGLNALAMVTMMVELAQLQTTIWKDNFDTEEDANQKLQKLKDWRNDLAAGVQARDRIQTSGVAAQRQNRRVGRHQHRGSDLFDFHTTESGRAGLQEGAHRCFGPGPRRGATATFTLSTSRNTQGKYSSRPRKHRAGDRANQEAPPRVILFTGHRIDTPDRNSAALSRGKGRPGASDDRRSAHEHQGEE